jgi:hypothetical protein
MTQKLSNRAGVVDSISSMSKRRTQKRLGLLFLCLLTFAVPLLAAIRNASASYTWTSYPVTSVTGTGTAGPTGIAAPTSEPILGDNFVPFAPFIIGAIDGDTEPPFFGFYVLGPTALGSNYEAWAWNGLEWTDFSDDYYFYGFSVDSGDDAYGFAWTKGTGGGVGGGLIQRNRIHLVAHRYLEHILHERSGVQWGLQQLERIRLVHEHRRNAN